MRDVMHETIVHGAFCLPGGSCEFLCGLARGLIIQLFRLDMSSRGRFLIYMNDEIKYCSICHRSEHDAGKMVDLPNGLHLCPDCMQKMIDAASQIDYADLMKQLQDGKFPHMPGGLPEGWENATDFLKFAGDGHGEQPADQTKTDPERANSSAAAARDGEHGDGSEEAVHDSERTGTDQSVAHDGAETDAAVQNASHAGANHDETGEGAGNSGRDDRNGDDSNDSDSEDTKKESRRPTVSFLNLGDIFGGGGGFGGQQKVKKRKKTGPKPVFTYDNIPAPHLLKAELDKYVIGQERAKKVVSVAAYNHYKRIKSGIMDDVEIEKSNILLIGPTGSGKTYLVKTLARLLDVPLAITDATNLTEAGYIGDDVESCISKLLAEADNDVDKAEKGIVFIDEIDKLAKKQNMNSRDVSGEAVQQGLLKLLEGSEVEVPVGANSKNAMVPMTTVDTSNILFICGGAFPALEGIIKQRLSGQTSMGFSAELKDQYENDRNILDKVTNDDLRAFGMIPEFIGRLPIMCSLQSLDEDMMVRILTEPKNAIISQYQKLLKLDDVDLEFEDGALRAIARQALKKETGARALRSIIEKYMLDIMYEIPKDRNIGKVTITEDYINGVGGPKIEIRAIEAAAPAGALEDKEAAARRLTGESAAGAAG